MEVYKIFSIEAARSLPNLPDGHPCKNIHGHSFKIIITVEGDIQKNSGFVMDFGDIDLVFNPIKKMIDQDKDTNYLEHLSVLRKSIIKFLIFLGITFVIAAFFSKDIFNFISDPLINALPIGSSLIATEVASPFLTPLKFAFYLALFVSIPFLIYQLIKFASPGLYFEEKIYFFPLVLGSILLFYLGITFAYFIILPIVFSFFSASTPENVMMMTDINLLLSFVIKMFFAFGLAFEMPIIIILLLVSNAVTVSKLISARPYVFLGCFVVGMLLTPPDVISQSLLAIPAWLLYELGIIVGRMLIRNKQ